MCTIGTSCHKGRRGTSTVFGTLIFIGILFTAVIPMYLIMRQADTLYERKRLELGLLDEARRSEDLYVYVYPTAPESPSLTVKAENKGELLIKVVRVWINDTYYKIDSAVQSLNTMSLGAYDVSPQDGLYFVKVTTDRGNVFASDYPIRYKGGKWEVGMFEINVLIYYESAGWYNIEVRRHNATTGGLGAYIANYAFPIKIHKSFGSTAFTSFDVTQHFNQGVSTYYINITRGSDIIIYNKEVTIAWPKGPPVVWVFA